MPNRMPITPSMSNSGLRIPRPEDLNAAKKAKTSTTPAVQCSVEPRLLLDRHVRAAERDLRQLPAELAVLARPADPDDRRPDARAGLQDRVLRQVAPEHGRPLPPRGPGREPRSATTSAPTASTTPSSRPSLEPAGYNDGIYNDPIWTKQGIDWLHEHGGQEQPWFMVVSLLNPHDIAYFPRGFTVDVTRPGLGGGAAAELRGRHVDQAARPQPVRGRRGADPRQHPPTTTPPPGSGC